ncbi:MAG: 2-amino-4-hydroxy-6-hydroxymethyldihydropteridine diphosphokinase [Phenylobacterium sp.]|uniref:2-amino-4-hydroxy-6- hydroxymethyldihydropteridine diphosphokinase n=1 Tax=Phenylobacterium sp. TaxID=1871053 RepID=UPI00120BD3C9|nr:2-amino-4-hydroxy-6-hydroxymethyldihydropteridine diphosphokinase [Phenylobacterium sp.]TAJ70401.1 MAG: 2-amino-4-hydroxy-6-hydroxymethyldihydropteridine diphosphokinase [Phenylobacterium sp.]
MVVALGSNLAGGYGSSEALLEAALTRFPAVGLKILKRSSWWRSAAWPDPMGPEYRNGVALVEAQGGPHEVLASLLGLEAELGRERAGRNAPRTLDLDLIAHGRQVLHHPDLTLPHPRAHKRLFVMGPLAEIAPDWVHPALGETAAALAAKATIGKDATPAA